MDSSGAGCFGCSPSNPVGLRLRFRRRGETVTARHAIADHFHGALDREVLLPGATRAGAVTALARAAQRA